MDGSDHTRNKFSVIQDFLYQVIDKLNVGPNNDRVAVIQFSNVAVANFFLNSFMRKVDILTVVRKLSHKGGRPLKMGAALQYVQEKVFTTESGSRHAANVPQVLVVFSSGASTDSVVLPVASLRERNITILSIGTKNFDHKEMETISHSPNYMMSVSDMAELPSIKEQVLTAIAEENLKAAISRPEVIGKNDFTMYFTYFTSSPTKRFSGTQKENHFRENISGSLKIFKFKKYCSMLYRIEIRQFHNDKTGTNR